MTSRSAKEYRPARECAEDSVNTVIDDAPGYTAAIAASRRFLENPAEPHPARKPWNKHQQARDSSNDVRDHQFKAFSEIVESYTTTSLPCLRSEY